MANEELIVTRFVNEKQEFFKGFLLTSPNILPMPEHSHQLAAILFADIVNYTAMMQEDENEALGKITRFRHVIEANVVELEGRIIQYYGDGCLVLFKSATDAVQFAKLLQTNFNEEPKVPVRIGIHMGDVLLQEENVFGDVVNIASRIQALAPVGSIFVSEMVYRNIANKKGIDSVFIKKEKLKNVTTPIKIYKVLTEYSQIAYHANEDDEQVTIDESSLAVLPIVNLNKMINCIIIDDEPLARKGLREYIADVEFLHLAGEYDNSLKAAEIISKGEVQLLFLDIQMPKITGLDFMKTLQKPVPVIFTTAFPQFALDGFELNALDYLVKPISFDRFLKAALKAKEYYEVRQTNDTDKTIAAETHDHFFIKADNKLVKIAFNDILFIEALQNYVVVHTRDKKLITYLTFKSVEEYLPSSLFMKVHKSFIVSASKIDSIEGNEIRIGQHHIPISRNLKDEVMEKLLKGKFLKR